MKDAAELSSYLEKLPGGRNNGEYVTVLSTADRQPATRPG
jgi:hypothetical protein